MKGDLENWPGEFAKPECASESQADPGSHMGGERGRRQGGLPNLSGEVALGNQRTDRKGEGLCAPMNSVGSKTGSGPKCLARG